MVNLGLLFVFIEFIFGFVSFPTFTTAMLIVIDNNVPEGIPKYMV